MNGEIGSLSNRLKIYKNNVLRNKKKKLKLETKKQVIIIKHKKKSKIKTFLMVLIGFIFGFFENIANKKQELKKVKSENIKYNTKENKFESIYNKKIKLNYVKSYSKDILYKKNKITYINKTIKFDNNVKSKENKSTYNKITNYNILNNTNKNLIKKEDNDIKQNNLKIINKKIGIYSNKILNDKIKLHNNKIDTCVKITKKGNDNILLFQQQTKNNKNVKNQNEVQNNLKINKEKNQEKTNKEKIQEQIDKEDIKKGIDIISRQLKNQKKFIDKEMEVLKKYKGKINDKLKINYFSMFLNNTFKMILSFLPISLFQNKLFGTLVSTILLNNSIKTMRNEINLKNNAKIIVPKYLTDMEKESDVINSTYDICIDSLEQIDLLKTEFTIKNHMYSKTQEYKAALESLTNIETQIKKTLEETEKLIKMKQEIEKNTKQKIYKIVKS